MNWSGYQQFLLITLYSLLLCLFSDKTKGLVMQIGLMLSFLIISIISAVASIHLVFKVSDFKTLTKILIIRSVVKVAVGILVGFLWALIVEYQQPNASGFILSISLAFLLAVLISLVSNKYLLKKLLKLDYSILRIISAHVTDFSIAMMLSVGVWIVFKILETGSV